MDTNDEWIRSRTAGGLTQVHHSSAQPETSDLSLKPHPTYPNVSQRIPQKSAQGEAEKWTSVRPCDEGIGKRHVISGDETLTSLAAEASKKALEMAGIDAKDLDLVLLATSSPDDIFGSACTVQAAIGADGALAFDVTAACSGFVVAVVNGMAGLFSPAPLIIS